MHGSHGMIRCKASCRNKAYIKFGCYVRHSWIASFNTSWLGQSVWYFTWWRHQMETSSALLAICKRNSPAIGEFPTQRPVKQSFGVFFYLRLKKRLSKQSWGWWFETLSHPLWRHCNDRRHFQMYLPDKCISYDWTEHSTSIKLIQWGQRALAHICITRPQFKWCVCHESLLDSISVHIICIMRWIFKIDNKNIYSTTTMS